MSAILSPLAGRLVDAGYSRQLLAGASSVAAGLLTALSQTDSFVTFVFIWLGIGTCIAGALYDPCFAFLVRTQGPQAHHAITLVTLVAGFAGTLSFPLNTHVAQ